MMMASTNNFGPFLAIHNFIDEDNLPPSAKRMWGALSGLFLSGEVVYICRSFFANKLNLKKETISRAITKLEEKGYIKRTGEYKFGIFPVVVLLKPPAKEGPLPISSSIPPVSKRSLPSDHSVTDPCAFDHTKEKRKEIIKEQTVASDNYKNNFSPNEKIALKQKLKSLGFHKTKIQKLLDKYSTEKLTTQLNNLEIAQSKTHIKSPVAWLLTALDKNYALKQSDRCIEEAIKNETDKKREAAMLAQKAKHHLDKGAWQEAKALATKSLAITPSSEAEWTLKKADDYLDRKTLLQKVLDKMTPELKTSLRKEIEEVKLKELRRWYKSDGLVKNSLLFKLGVEALFEERVMNMVA